MPSFRMECPHCHERIAVVDDSGHDDEVVCPSCKSRIVLTVSAPTEHFSADVLFEVDRYEAHERIGKGSFGVVYRGRDSVLGRDVAIKVARDVVIDAGMIEEFLRDGRVCAKMRHDNIVEIHDVGVWNDTPYIVYELIRGVNLAQEIVAKPPSLREAAEACCTIAKALQHAHDQGVVHRDLKPGNVMVESDSGRLYLVDFGLAKLNDPTEITVAVDGRPLGTLAYMSPEQLRGDANRADGRSDVYSLGVMLYEMISGVRPYTGESQVIRRQIELGEPRTPRSINAKIPRDLQTICLKAMARLETDRYQSAGEMGEDLQRFLDGEPIRARPVGLVPRAYRRAKRNPVVTALTGIVGVLTIVLLFVWFGQPDPEPKDQHAGSKKEEPKKDLRDVVLTVAIPKGTSAVDLSSSQLAAVRLHPLRRTPLAEEPIRVAGGKGGKTQVKLAPGAYIIAVWIPNYGYHEVYRTVPKDGAELGGQFDHLLSTDKDGQVELPKITVLPQESVVSGMTLLRGGAFQMGDDRVAEMGLKKHRQVAGDFYMDQREVTQGAFVKLFPKVAQRQGVNALATTSSMAFVSQDEAIAFAEKAGKQLPTEIEQEYAGTNRGTTVFPWGKDPASPDQQKQMETFDVTRQPAGIRGLASGLEEWSSSPATPFPGTEQKSGPLKQIQDAQMVTHVVVRCGKLVTEFKKQFGPTYRIFEAARSQLPNVGFRCVYRLPRFGLGK